MGPKFNFSQVSDSPGKLTDLQVLQAEDWLADTEVKYAIRFTKGRWEVSLVFIDITNPLRFVKWAINNCATYNKARIFGDHYRRIAARDVRGYLKSNLEDLQLCMN
ncbi:MAG: hypothetical protein MRY78_02980 [Saprospiraceae bacterium]|nr:hypothetical protein [Saprospiraceae bacterium]